MEVLLDGELVGFEDRAVSFDALQARLTHRAPWPGAVAFVPFDLLWQERP
jgi:ATP-dependent DNA ligase